VCFDRRYWWAQLQRSITSRSIISKSEQHRKKLGVALEQLAEGYYEINWQGAIFTFWTDSSATGITQEKISLAPDVVLPPLQVPDSFSICHIAMGHEGVVSLFTKPDLIKPVELLVKPIWVRPNFVSSVGLIDGVEDIIVGVVDVNVVDEVDVLDNDSVIGKPDVLDEVEIVENDKIVDETEDLDKDDDTPVVEDPLPIIKAFSVPDKILIGKKSNGEPVYWHYGHSQLANRHMIIFGAPGFGKTYGIQCLLAEMAHQNIHSLIIDYTDGFLPGQLENYFTDVTRPKNHYVYHEKLPLNPFQKQQQIIDPNLPAFEETSFDVATRITKIFKSVFSLGEQQFATLVRVLEFGLSNNKDFNLNNVLDSLKEDESNYSDSLVNKFEPLIKSDPFRPNINSNWNEILTTPDILVHILQLTGFSSDIQKIVTEFVLWDLYDYAKKTGSKNRPIPVVLDEIQNLDHSKDSPIDKMIREGRKFGLSMILATQNIERFDNEQQSRLFMASHKLFFKPADTEIEKFAKLLSIKDTSVSKSEWSVRLSKLEKGQCWSVGSVLMPNGKLLDKAILLNITKLEDRDLGY
jgi:DNA phosphorothioation-dependent restriction protein DptH